ncbi:hypothetical protein QYF36_019617 [Acer negundo]|nr:hypothetical protein QYF36_019617 [Acer negundo]
MSHPEEEEIPKATPTAPPPAVDLEDPAPNSGTGTGTGTGTRTGFGVSAITQRWKREDLLNRGGLALRGLGLLFSLLAFIIMGSNKHGDWKNFDKYEEYRYVLAAAILATLYTGAQTLRHIHEMSTGRQMLQRRTSALLDFFGDQVSAYLLISAGSSAIPLTNRMREGADNIFTDSSAAAIGMELLAFLALALSALISGYKLTSQNYI